MTHPRLLGISFRCTQDSRKAFPCWIADQGESPELQVTRHNIQEEKQRANRDIPDCGEKNPHILDTNSTPNFVVM